MNELNAPLAALFNFSVVDAVKGNDKMEHLATMQKGPLTERATSDLNSEWLRCPQLSCYPLYKPMQDMEDVNMTIKMQMTGTLTRVTRRTAGGKSFPL